MPGAGSCKVPLQPTVVVTTPHSSSTAKSQEEKTIPYFPPGCQLAALQRSQTCCDHGHESLRAPSKSRRLGSTHGTPAATPPRRGFLQGAPAHTACL